MTFALRITVTGIKKATSSRQSQMRIRDSFKVVMVKTEHKVYQDATDVMVQQVVTDVMDATVKTS